MRLGLRLFAFAISTAGACTAQTLVIHAIDADGSPLKRLPVAIRYNFGENRSARRGEVVNAKTNTAGDAVFQQVHLDAGGFSVLTGGMCDAPRTTPIFLLSGLQTSYDKSTNPVFNTLPATVTVVVSRSTFVSCLSWILSGGS